MPELVTSAVTALMNTVPQIFSVVTAADGMGPWFALGVAASVILLVVLIIRKVVWGA